MTRAPIRGAEFDFVVAACVAPSSAHADAVARLDWALVRRLSARHRVDGLVSQSVEALAIEGPAAGVVEELRQSAHALAFDYLGQLAETLRLVRLIEGHGHGVIVLKGCPLAAMLYAPRPQLRHSVDIDLMVAPESHADVAALLVSEGYVRTTPLADIPPEAASMARYLSSAFEYFLDEKGMKVELHHRLLSDPSVMEVSFAELVRRSRRVDVAAGQVSCLGADDLFVYLCCHAAAHSFFRLKWLADIARWVAARPFDEAAVLAHAERVGGAPHVRLSLAMLAHLGAGRRDDARGADRESRRIAALVPVAMRAVMRPDEPATEFRMADVGDNLRDLGYEWRLSPSRASREYRLVTRLCNHKDLLTLKRGVEWRWAYAALGRPLALVRYAQRFGKSSAPASDRKENA